MWVHHHKVVIVYDDSSQVVKFFTLDVFDEGFNDLPGEAIPTNSQQNQSIHDVVCKEINDDIV